MPFTYTHDCIECNREYESEDKWPGFCPRCARRCEAQNLNDVGPKTTGYTTDMMRKGANRHALRILNENKPKGTT